MDVSAFVIENVDGNLFFKYKDSALALGYPTIRNAIDQHMYPEDKQPKEVPKALNLTHYSLRSRVYK